MIVCTTRAIELKISTRTRHGILMKKWQVWTEILFFVWWILGSLSLTLPTLAKDQHYGAMEWSDRVLCTHNSHCIDRRTPADNCDAPRGHHSPRTSCFELFSSFFDNLSFNSGDIIHRQQHYRVIGVQNHMLQPHNAHCIDRRTHADNYDPGFGHHSPRITCFRAFLVIFLLTRAKAMMFFTGFLAW